MAALSAPSNTHLQPEKRSDRPADDDGQIHLCGNMHCVPLIYFRTEKPGDIFHTNTLEILDDRAARLGPAFAAGHYLVSVREIEE